MADQTYLIDLQFLPSIEYMLALQEYPDIVYDQHEHFVKQSYRNRSHILGANGLLKLVVPVVGGSQKTPMAEVLIDYKQPWARPLWKSIQSAYGRSPFFEHYADELKEIMLSQPKLLLDLNRELLSFCLSALGMDSKMSFSDRYWKPEESRLVDLRATIHPKTDPAHNGLYQPFAYTQLFGNNFVANLSIIDALFCEGPYATEILKKSRFNA